MNIYSLTNIKISKFDINGNNNTSNLENLLYFTLKYSDINSIQYDIIDKKEYPDYFLFTIKTNPFQQSSDIDTLASSSDNNTLNYFTSASYPGNLPFNATGSILIYNTILNNSLGYLNTSSGQFILGNTPNIPITLIATASIYSVNGTLGTELRVYKQNSGSTSLIGTSGFSYTQASLGAMGSATLYISGSFTPIKGERYVVVITDDSPSDTDITASNVRLLITQSIQHNVGVSGSGDLLVLITPGENAENPLLNNADSIILNPNYLTLDYTEYRLPDNEFQLILSGSGTNSTIKQYNYEANRITIPRYKGSRSTSPDWNLNTTEGGLGVSPNVEKNNIYFAAINTIEDTSPEILNTSVANFKFLIDDQGNTYELNNDPSNISFYNSTFTFEKDKPIIISDSTGINYNSSVYKSGFDVIPILHSDMGTYFEPTLSFSSTGVGNYLHNATFKGYGGGSSPYNWIPQLWGSQNGGNVNVNEGNNNGRSLFLKYPTSASSFDTSLVDILNVVVPSNIRVQANSGYQGAALDRFYSGSIYHVKTSRPNTSLKFEYNFHMYAEASALSYNNQTTLPWIVTISICRDNIVNVPTDGIGNILWDVDLTPTTQILTRHIYKGNHKTTPQSTDVWTGGNYNSSTNTTIYTFNGANPTPPHQLSLFNTWNNNFTDFWCKIETDFIPDLQIDDIIGIHIKLQYPAAGGGGGGGGTFFSIYTTPTQADFNNNINFKSHHVYSDPIPSLLIIPSPAPFFTTSSGDPYTLIAYKTSASISNPTCTSGLAQAFGYKQQDISESGYKPITNISQPKIGDQIRFNYDESTSYNIMNIGINTDSNVTLLLDKPIPDGLDLNWFLIRRYIKNPSKMIINSNYIQTDGFAFPEYMSKNIINNLPKIIEKLKIQGLI